MSKRHFSLIEVLIGLSLTVVILSTLMWSYRSITEMGRKMDQERATAFQFSLLQNRFYTLLPLALSDPFYLSDYQGHPSLVFEFEKGADLNKDFAGRVIGRFFLDKQKRFCFAVMPHSKSWIKGEIPPIRMEVLLEEVEKVHFSFFTVSKEGVLTLVDEWAKELKAIPAVVKIEIQKKDQGLRVFNIVLPRALPEIVI